MNVTKEDQGDQTAAAKSDDPDLLEEPLNLSPDYNANESFKEDPLENQNSDATSETLPELPQNLLAKVPNGKRIYGACVRKQCRGVTIYLLDYDVWQIFCAEGNEMIITKKGRRMFPVPSFFVCDLEPEKLYELSLELNALNNRVYKYTNGKWVATKEGSYLYPTPVPGRDAYVHYHSPNTGDYWMREPVSFATLKISNNLDALGTIVLQSMRKYVMVLIICDREAGSKIRIRLPETVFVAVTQYQNDNITKMKIEHNPFANAFRMSSGKSKDKDKEKSKKQLPVKEADSEDEGRTQEVSSTNQTPAPPGQLLPENMWALSRPEMWCPNPFQLSAFIEQRRQILQNLLPPGSDILNVTSPQLGQSVNNVVGWPHGLPPHALRQSLYTPPQLPEMPMDDRFMFPFQGFNPLAQVRQFGELNRCSDLEVPLSLVKKLKPQSNMMPSGSNMNSEPQNFRQSPTNFRPVPGNLQNEESVSHRQMQMPAGHIPTDTNIGLANARSPYNRLVPDIVVMPQSSSDLATTINYPSLVPKHNSPGLPKPVVILRNSDLWETTHEIILTPSGRPMFPFISLAVYKLHPDQQYSFILKFVLCSNYLYEYRQHQWVPSRQVSEEEDRDAVYPHPDNPKNGCQWGSEVIFDKLRLSTLRQGKNMLKLQLRRQYLPHVVIKTDTELWEFPLKDIIFITVKIDRSTYLGPEMWSQFVSENQASQARPADRPRADQTEDEEVPDRNG